MTVRIKAHFDGRTIVPDEPVAVPAGTTATVEFTLPETRRASDSDRRASLERLFKMAVAGVSLPLEATRREHLYEDRA